MVTGATGPFGEAAIGFLLSNGIPPGEISALVRDPGKAGNLVRRGITIKKGDYRDYPSLLDAFRGVGKLLFVSGSELSDRLLQHENVVRAAKDAGVKQVVYTSILATVGNGSSPIAIVTESHARTEQWLMESGMDFTIMRNTIYMDMLPASIGKTIRETRTIYLPAGEGRSAYLLRTEMAEAAANVLSSTGHEGKVYEITSEKAWSYADVARILTGILGVEIRYASPSPEEFSTKMKQAGMPDMIIGMSLGWSQAMAEGTFAITGKTMEQLLGRKPTGPETFLKQVYSK